MMRALYGLISLPAMVVTLYYHSSACAQGREIDFDFPLVQLEVKVVDQDGAALSDAEIGGTFCDRNNNEDKDRSWFRSDVTGKVLLHKHFCIGQSILAKKEGYHTGGYRYNVAPYNKSTPMHAGLPAERPTLPARFSARPIVITLIKRKNPALMNKKQVSVFVPGEGKAVGYDLLQGDWIRPWGNGTVSDIEVTVSDAQQEPMDPIKVVFPGEGNGFKRIVLRDPEPQSRDEQLAALRKKMRDDPEWGVGSSWVGYEGPFTAAPEGYQRELSVPVGVVSLSPELRELLVVRIRSHMTEKGVLVGNYGKILRLTANRGKQVQLTFMSLVNPVLGDTRIEEITEPRLN